MKKSLYPNDVEVDTQALNFTEDTKIDELLRRTLALGNQGIINGLRVTVNGTFTNTIDITGGEAMVADGNISTVTGLANVALIDNTAGGVNYVTVDYAEVDIIPEPLEDGTGTALTRRDELSSIVVRNAVTFAALTSAQLAKLTVIAIVTATGGALSSSSINQIEAFPSILYATQPVAVTGIDIRKVDFTMDVGTGVLDFDASPGNGLEPGTPAPRARWQSPNDAYGPYVEISVNGQYVLTSFNGTTATIDVITAALPSVDVTENIPIQNLYAEDTPNFTARDMKHRSFLGSGTPTPTNPHGLTLEDIGGSTQNFIIEHQILEHSNGIQRESDPLFMFVTPIPIPGPTPDELNIVQGITGDSAYVNGRLIQQVTSTQLTFLISVSPNISLYDVYVDEVGIPKRALRAEHPASPTVTGVAVIDIDDEMPAGVKSLQYNLTNNTLSFDGGTPVLLRGDGNYTLYSATGDHWVRVNVGDTNDLGYGTLPNVGGPTFTDGITFGSPVSFIENLLIARVAWDGVNVLGYRDAVLQPMKATDKRRFGVTSRRDIADDQYRRDEVGDPATRTVGDGIETFGDYNGPSGIQEAINDLISASIAGSILVRAGIYDPFTLNHSDTKIIGEGASTIIDGNGTAYAIRNQGSSNAYHDLVVQNATTGIQHDSGVNCRGYGLRFGGGLTTPIVVSLGTNNIYNLEQLVNKYNAVVGSVSDFNLGLATHTSLNTAIAAVNAGDRILILPVSITENVTVNKRCLIEGTGRDSIITGTMVVSASLVGIKDMKVTGNITISGNDNYLATIWQTDASIVTDSGSDNVYIVIGE